jgi:hypothetical protein
MYSHKRVLVALDGSAAGEAVMKLLMEIAGPLDMTIMLVHVLEPSRVGRRRHGRATCRRAQDEAKNTFPSRPCSIAGRGHLLAIGMGFPTLIAR